MCIILLLHFAWNGGHDVVLCRIYPRLFRNVIIVLFCIRTPTNIAPHSNVNLENKIYETEKKSYGLYIIYSELGLACHCPILYPWNMKIY